MLAPRTHKIATYVAFTCLYAGIALGLSMVWLDFGDTAVTGKLMFSLIVIFVGSTLTMALASVSSKDPDAKLHKSFHLTVPTQDPEPRLSVEQGGREEPPARLDSTRH